MGPKTSLILTPGYLPRCGDPLRFAYPDVISSLRNSKYTMTALEGKYLSVHHPQDVQDARDEASDETALCLVGRLAGYLFV